MRLFFLQLGILLLAVSCAEETVSPCEGVVCSNGGVCRAGKCQCPPSHTGENCQTVNTGTITVTNNTFTPVTLVINGQSSTIDPAGTKTVTDVVGKSIVYSAETSGKTSTGGQVGLPLVWNFTEKITKDPKSIPLNVGSEFFFLKIRNNSVNTLAGLYVNYGLSQQTYETNFSLPPGGSTFNLGYYRSYSNSVVRILIPSKPGFFYQWQSLAFPGTNNQSITLTAI